MKNPFDFTDVSDLPEDLQAKVQIGGAGKAQEYADIVVSGAQHGLAEMTINQIMAVAHRMGKEVPKQNTVRNYLNKAVELKLLTKPTTLTYGPPEGVKVTKAAAVETAEPDPVVTSDTETGAKFTSSRAEGQDTDPLAALGLDT